MLDSWNSIVVRFGKPYGKYVVGRVPDSMFASWAKQRNESTGMKHSHGTRAR